MKRRIKSEVLQLRRPDGSIMHAEVRVGDSAVMMGEPMDEFRPMPAPYTST